MNRVKGSNVEVSVDFTGGLISVDWTCPYCGDFNAGFSYTSDGDVVESDFEIDCECESCGEEVIVECRNTKPLF